MFKYFVLQISLIFSLFVLVGCEDRELDFSSLEFGQEYLDENRGILSPIQQAYRRVAIASSDEAINYEFSGDRLVELIYLEVRSPKEEADLSRLLRAIGFQQPEEYIEFHRSIATLANTLAEQTNFAEKPVTEVRNIIAGYIYENAAELGIEVTKPLEKAYCGDDYDDCEADVSASLAGDLGECAVATAVTGLSTGGLGGIIVGGACAANALYQGVIASRACVRNHCP